MGQKNIIEYFIHDGLKELPDTFWRSKVIVIGLLTLQIVSMALTAIAGIYEIAKQWHIFIPALIIPVLLFWFKRKGQIQKLGNIICLIQAIYITPLAFFSGGLYSDDLIWMLLIPVTAFTLTNFKTGLFWAVYLFAVQGVYFYLEATATVSFINDTDHWTATFYYGSIAFLFFAVLMMMAASKIGTGKIIEELTLQKEQLRQKSDELEEKKNLLEAAEKTLKSSNEELEQFAYVVSHDLKQPLRNINTFSTLLEKHLQRQITLDQNAREYLDFIKSGTVNMNQLIEDIMTYSRAGNSQDEEKVSIEMQNIQALIEHNLRNQIEETDADLIWQNVPEILEFPKTQMVQILQNLISNAVKYRKEHIAPIIIVEVRDEITFWKFSIQDNGRGISNADSKKVFDLFTKLTGTNQEGSGIGLATVRKIIEKHGGEIWVQSEEGIGSCFQFTIPKKRWAKEHKEIGQLKENPVKEPSLLN